MPNVSPVSPASTRTPRGQGFPFPSLDSSRGLETDSSLSTLATTVPEWPRGPSIPVLTYFSLSNHDEASAQLELMLLNLGQWLSAADSGMAILSDT